MLNKQSLKRTLDASHSAFEGDTIGSLKKNMTINAQIWKQRQQQDKHNDYGRGAPSKSRHLKRFFQPAETSIELPAQPLQHQQRKRSAFEFDSRQASSLGFSLKSICDAPNDMKASQYQKREQHRLNRAQQQLKNVWMLFSRLTSLWNLEVDINQQ